VIYFNKVTSCIKKFATSLPLLNTLRIIFFVSILVRVIIFNFLPATPSSLAPDEGTYADLVKFIASGKNTEDYPGFGPGLYATSRVLILPALYLNYYGFSPLDSVRVISSLFGALSAFMLLIYSTYILQINKNIFVRNIGFKITFILFFATFTFLPSRFLWSVVGLRESANEFLLICLFISLNFFLFHAKNSAKKYIYLSLCSILIICLMSIRIQVALVVYLSFWIIFFTIKLNYRDRLVYLIVFLFMWVPIQQIANVKSNIVPESTKQEIFSLYTINTEQKALGNTVNAESDLKIVRCPEILTNNEYKALSNLFCNAYRIPTSIPPYLFRPFFGSDTYSLATYLAALENLIWLIGVFFVFSNAILKRKILYFEYLRPAAIFSIAFICAASIYEGNLGTAFRHKTLIIITLFLWVILIQYSNALNKKNK
jgi:hypothetical protein